MTQPKKRAYCYACHTDFEYDWREWARHQNEMCAKDKKDKAHKKNLRFAARILTNVRALNSKKELPTRTPLTEEQKEARNNLIRPTSGNFERVKTMCPQCQRFSEESLEVEYVKDDKNHAWQRGNYFMRLCVNHRNDKSDF